MDENGDNLRQKLNADEVFLNVRVEAGNGKKDVRSGKRLVERLIGSEPD
jgi:hypothetical protein